MKNIKKRIEDGEEVIDRMNRRNKTFDASFLLKVHVQDYIQGRAVAQVFIPLQILNKNLGPLPENVQKPLPVPSFVVFVNDYLHVSCYPFPPSVEATREGPTS